jgi:hypothetical protein
VPKDYLVYGPTDTQEGVVEQFEQMFGIIETPSKKLVL